MENARGLFGHPTDYFLFSLLLPPSRTLGLFLDIIFGLGFEREEERERAGFPGSRSLFPERSISRSQLMRKTVSKKFEYPTVATKLFIRKTLEKQPDERCLDCERIS